MTKKLKNYYPEPKKEKTLIIRIAADDMAMLKDLAKKYQVSVSEFVRKKCLG